MKFWVTLEGHEAEVEFHTEDGRLFVETEGRRIEADFVRLPDGEVYSLLVGGRSHVVRVSPTADGLDVEIRGFTLPIEVRHPLEKLLQQTAGPRTKGRGETISAPMPGVVVVLRVKPGDAVAAGQSVVVIEAMKMQNELVARSGGRVHEVLVAEREAVAAGQPLVRLQPEDA